MYGPLNVKFLALYVNQNFITELKKPATSLYPEPPDR